MRPWTAADASDGLRSMEHGQVSAFILGRTQIGFWVLTVVNILFGTADFLSSSTQRLPIVALRLAFMVGTIVLAVVARSQWAITRAVPLALTVVAIATAQAIEFATLRGDAITRAVLIIALGVSASLAVPWGVRAQLAAVSITGIGALVIVLPVTRLDAPLLTYLMTAAGMAAMSVYAAHLFRRSFILSLRREIDQEQTAWALQASEERSHHQLTQLDALYRSAPIGLALVDVNCRYLRINQALADMNGIPAELHVGRTIREVVPDVADTLESVFRGIVATGEPVLDIELSGTTSHYPDATRHWRASLWPVHNPDRNLIAVSCVVQEITEQKRVQEELRQNEERLRIVSQTARDAIWDWTIVTDALWCNERMRTLFGYPGGKMSQWMSSWYDNIHSADRDYVWSEINGRIAAGADYWSVEYRYRWSDGSWGYVLDRGTVFRDADGQPQRMVGTVTDIADRKRAEEALARLNTELEQRVHERTHELAAANAQLEHEIAVRREAAEALRESQEQLQAILDNTPAVIYLKDTAGRYLLINLQYESLFHVSREQAIGKTDYDIFPSEVADAFRANDRQVASANRALAFDEAAPHDDGLHSYISLKFPLRDSRGQPYGVCGISTDITSRKLVEAELRASQAQLSALIENTNDAIWSIDRQYRLTAFNSVVRQWLLEAHGTALQLGATFVVPDEERDYWQPLYDRTLAGERILLERDYTIAGEMHTYLISMTPIAAEGEVTGATVYAKDITALRRAEERVRQHQAELTHVLRVNTVGEMAAGLAHEINQPLGAIANFARGCHRRLASGSMRPEELLPVIDDIADQALRAGEIIRRLRALVQKGRTPHEEADLNAIVSDAAHVVEPQARYQGVTLSIDLAPGLPQVEVDQIQIAQVILNLMLNGLESMQTANGAEPELSVRTTTAADGALEVAVGDTGTGLTSAISENMFEPFFSSKPSGLGLGLAISRSIVEEHGGRLWATNNAGHGATFHMTIPPARRAKSSAM